MTIFKIKNTETGLYSTGGTYPTFTKNGKNWNNRNALSNHIGLVDKYCYRNCIIEEYELTYTPTLTHSINEWSNKLEQNRKLREEQYALKSQQQRAEREIAELKRLQALYDKC